MCPLCDARSCCWLLQVLGAHVAQLMPAYSAFYSPESPDGAPDCANEYLIKTVLRGRFGAVNMSVISDNGGIEMVYQTHKCACARGCGRRRAGLLCFPSRSGRGFRLPHCSTLVRTPSP